jgi:hypothetical protein
VMGLVAIGLDLVSALAAKNETDPRLVWPKNSQFTCRGVLTQEEGTYRLTPDQNMLTWCDADIGDKDRGRLLDACRLGGRCEIKGIIRGHGVFGWSEISVIAGIANTDQLPEPFLGDWSSDDVGDIEITGISVTQHTYHEPGYNCDIRSAQRKNEATPNRPVYFVEMRCSGEGPQERPQLVREVWALRKVNNVNVLAIAGVGGATFPSIHLLRRPKQ